jgi:hypothetical protein
MWQWVGAAKAGGAIGVWAGCKGCLCRTMESNGQGWVAAGCRAGVHMWALQWRHGMKGREGAGRASWNSRASMRATASAAVRLGQNIVSKSGGESV